MKKSSRSLVLYLALAIVLLTTLQCCAANNILSFGAIGDGTTLATASIQKAIDTCSDNGGGTITVPPGTFLIGTLVLKNNVTLHLDKGATLLGSPNINDYRMIDSFKEGTGQTAGLFLFGSVDADHIGIDGEGTIDGQGATLQKSKLNGTPIRPFLLRFVRSQNISVSGLHLTNSAMWCMHIGQCKTVAVSGITITNHSHPNNDGIDVDSSEHVTIRDCDINTDDDAICLKTTSPSACRDITVIGCTLKSKCAAVKLGTESVGDFENISISHCQIRDTHLGGLKIISMDGSHISNLTFADVTMDAVMTPIFIRLGSRLKTYHPGDTPRDTGSIENITIRNIKATHSTGTGLFITGVPGHPVGGGITFDNLDLELAGGLKADAAAAIVPESPAAYPEITRFGKFLPASGVYARHVSGLRITHLKVSETQPDARPAVSIQDAQDIKLNDCSFPAIDGPLQLVRLISAKNILLQAIQSAAKVALFVNIEGKDSNAVMIENPPNAAQLTQLEPGVSAAAVIVH